MRKYSSISLKYGIENLRFKVHISRDFIAISFTLSINILIMNNY